MVENLPNISCHFRNGEKSTKCILTPSEMVINLPSVFWRLKEWRKIYTVYPDSLRTACGKSNKCILTPLEMVKNLPRVACPLRNGEKSTRGIMTPSQMVINLPSVFRRLKKCWKIYQVYHDSFRNGGKSTKCIMPYKKWWKIYQVFSDIKRWWKIYQVYPDSLRNGGKSTKCILIL